MTNNDDFQKKAFELWMAVTMFMSTYANESNNIVKKVSSMLPYATDLQNFWSAYQSAQSNSLIRNLHTKIRARVRLMRDLLEQSIASCGDNQKLLDKYSENQNYIERKLNDLYSMIPNSFCLISLTMLAMLAMAIAMSSKAMNRMTAFRRSPRIFSSA